jgi:soluble lytic murein transglycosylase-like protein
VQRALVAVSIAVLGLISSACQTTSATALLRARTETAPLTASAEPETPAAPSVTRPPAARPPALAQPRPRLSERLGELLVARAPDLAPVDRARVASAIEDASEAHQLDPLLVLAIIEQESGFDPSARGHGGSIGLMQVRPFVARDVAKRHGIPWKGPRMLLDPAANVAIGACYLGEMFDMYSDPALAIAAYNLGPYRVQRLVARGRNPRPPYLLSVLARYQVFSSQFGPIEPDDIEDADAD